MMPFGLFNASTAFQHGMMAMLFDMIEDSIEIFIDKFSISPESFDSCFANLKNVLKRCEGTNLVFNWKKMKFYGEGRDNFKSQDIIQWY